MNNKNETKLGVFYALFAFGFWGLVPIYFKAVSSVPAIEVLLHRVIWSVVFLFFVLLYKKEFKNALALMKNKKISIYLLASSIVIAFNWLTFIWAISHNKILETSLGYYINPLVTIFFGFIFLKEIPSKKQKIAIFLGFLAVCFQLYTLGYFPIVSLILALTFPTYGLIRKKIHVSSLTGLFIETLLIFPVAFAYLLFLIWQGENHFSFSSSPTLAFLLVLAGFITVVPLLAFNSATTRLKLSTIGFFQYIGPSVSLLLAIFVYNEPLNNEKLITFSLIWLALLIVSLDSLKRKKHG